MPLPELLDFLDPSSSSASSFILDPSRPSSSESQRSSTGELADFTASDTWGINKDWGASSAFCPGCGSGPCCRHPTRRCLWMARRLSMLILPQLFIILMTIKNRFYSHSNSKGIINQWSLQNFFSLQNSNRFNRMTDLVQSVEITERHRTELSLEMANKKPLWDKGQGRAGRLSLSQSQSKPLSRTASIGQKKFYERFLMPPLAAHGILLRDEFPSQHSFWERTFRSVNSG